MTIGFEELLAPLTVAEFVDGYFEQRPLLRRGCPDRHKSIFSLGEVEAAIAAAPTSPKDEVSAAYGFRFARGERESYSFDEQGPVGRSNAAAHRALDEGYTIVANTLQHHHQGIAALCTSMEAALQHSVGCNLYLTPPGEQGFAPHADGHDTFLVQIEGAKTWSIWSPPHELPQAGSTVDDRPPDRPPDLVVDVHAGDLLYIPHGWWHEGVTDPSTLSLHITLGLITIKWIDLLVAGVRRLADDNARLRRSVPFAGIDVAFDDMAADLWENVRMFLGGLAVADPTGSAGIEAVASILTERLVGHHAPFDQRLTETMTRHRLGPTDEVEHRTGLRPLVVDADGGCKIHFVGGFVLGPAAAREALEYAARTQRFCALDLPGLPTELSVQLVQEFVLQGLVRPVALGAAGR